MGIPYSLWCKSFCTIWFSCCRVDGIEPSRLLLDSAADDLTLAVLEQSIALREAGRAAMPWPP